MSTQGHSAKIPGLRQNGRHHLIQKLHFRELYGEARQARSRPRQRMFYQLPHRLAFSLSQIAPKSALAAGHVFLGFTKCGQFVLSYTHSCDTDDHTLQMNHRYRLHWWVFVPYAPLRKAAEVMLFGEQDLQESLYENLFISVCQWPRDLSKILVYGCSSMLDGSEGNCSQTSRCYITITAVPSLDNCSACYQVATSYEEEDLAERWNSCVRFSCLKHGITVHTSFEMVSPYPKFLPWVQMKRKGYVVLNAGNFIHVLNVDLENTDRKMKDVEAEIRGARLNCIKEQRVDDEESEDEGREQRQVKNRRVSGEQCHVPNLRSGKEYSLMDSSNSDVDPDIDAQSSCEEEEVSAPGKDHSSSLAGAGLKITLNNSGRFGCSSSMTDKDREWEILIGNIPSGSEVRTRGESSVGGNSECSANLLRGSCEGEGGPCCSDGNNCDNRNSNVSESQNNDVVLQGVAQNLMLKEFQLPDDSPYHLCSDNEYFNDDSDDSTRCSHVSEDSRFGKYELRDSTVVSERCRAGTNHPTGKGDDNTHSAYVSQQQSRMVLRSSSESSCGEKTPTKQAEKEYEFIDEISDSRHEKLSVFRRRRLADKKYEFSDENMENIPQNYSSYRSQSRRILMSPSRSPRFRSMAVPLSELSIELGESSGLFRTVYEKLLSPSSGSGSPNDVLRPINQNITSPLLSPRDDRWREEIDRIEKVVCHTDGYTV